MHLFNLLFRFYGLRKQNASNAAGQVGEDDSCITLQNKEKGGDVTPTPIITVTTPSKGSCSLKSPKKVIY